MVNLTSINNFVKDFFVANDSEQLSDVWMSKDNQTPFRTLVSNVSNANGKKLKDPNAPKHAMSAYLFFCQENRSKTKSEMPENVTNIEVTRELGKRWKALDKNKSATAKYHRLADADRKRYQKEKSEYVPSEEFVASSGKRSPRDPLAPKRAKSAYLFFNASNRDRVKAELGEGASNNDIVKELGRQWNEIKNDPDACNEYVLAAQQDKERFLDEKKSYLESHGDSSKKQTKQASKAAAPKAQAAQPEVKSKAKTVVSKPAPAQTTAKRSTVAPKAQAAEPEVKKGKTGFILFSGEKRPGVKEQNPGLQSSEIGRLLGTMWKALSDDERETYNARAREQ